MSDLADLAKYVLETVPLGQLDVRTVVKAAQALSSEVLLDRLVKTLMTIAVEHAGAERGLLLLPEGDGLRIEAEATVGPAGLTVDLRRAPVAGAELPASVLQYAIRTRQSVILGGARTPGPFSADEYLARRRPRAALCLALVNRSQLAGVLYLENGLASHAFSTSGVAVLELLASQAAVALENARLYANLRESENRIRLAIDTIPTLAWVTGPDGAAEFLNQPWLSFTGLAERDALGWGWVAAIHPDDRPQLEARWRRAFALGEPAEHEARMRRFDGEYRWFLFRAECLRSESGKIVKWYGTNTEIHERRRMEALLAGEKRLLELVASGGSLSTILLALCELAEEQCGCLASILLLDPDGRTVRHGAAPNLPEAYLRAIDGASIGPSAGSCGTAIYRRAPVVVEDIATDPLWADYRDLALPHGLRACWSTPILSQAGKALGSFAMYYREPRRPTAEQRGVIDRISHLASIALDRLRSEAALRRSEVYLAEAQRLSLTGSFGWNVATQEIFWSDQTYRIFDVDRTVKPTRELVLERVHPDDVPIVGDAIQRAEQTGDDWELEHRLLMPDGTVKRLHVVARAFRAESGALEYIGAVMDVTAIKREAERLQTSLEDKEALLKEVHHRVKNNLQLISSLLNLQAGLAPDPGVAELFADSRNRVRSMALVHENLYRAGNFARISMATHVRTLCDQLIRAYHVPGRRVEFGVSVSDIHLDIEKAVSCGLIINELVSNALKHAFPDGRPGTLQVELRPLDAGRCLLCVRDDGVGLPDGLQLDRIHSLGLQLVQDLTAQLHGDIDVSRDGGTAFTITFPSVTTAR